VLLARNIRTIGKNLEVFILSSQIGRLFPSLPADDRRKLEDGFIKLEARTPAIETSLNASFKFYVGTLQDLAKLDPGRRTEIADSVRLAFVARGLQQYLPIEDMVLRQVQRMADTGASPSANDRRSWPLKVDCTHELREAQIKLLDSKYKHPNCEEQ
jgi:hypothetical protein